MNQRWLFGRDRYRPPSEVITTRDYDVAAIPTAEAKQFITTHHYSRSWVYDRFRFGLFHHGRLVGVAVFSHPVNDASTMDLFGGSRRESVELGRFVLLDAVPGNGESWFLGRAFRLLRNMDDLRGVIAFSDPVARRSQTGDLVFAGHIGTIYQAHNGAYLGRATPRTLRLLPDGSVMNSRRMQKIRSGEPGWRPAADSLMAYGADEPWDDRAAWLRHWLNRLTRGQHHPGNHKYAWPLHRSIKLSRRSLAYPKAVQV
jgi:hypothetical protein